MNILVNSVLFFAQAYGSGTYDCSSYSTGTCGATASTGAGGLSNTGFALIAVITAACLIIFTALVVRFARRKAKA